MHYTIEDGVLKATIERGDVLTVGNEKLEYQRDTRTVERKLTKDDLRRHTAGTLDVEFLIVNQLAKEGLQEIKDKLGL